MISCQSLVAWLGHGLTLTYPHIRAQDIREKERGKGRELRRRGSMVLVAVLGEVAGWRHVSLEERGQGWDGTMEAAEELQLHCRWLKERKERAVEVYK
jgi:hypothetical protein